MRKELFIQADSKPLEGIRVLIAEDSQDIQLLMVRMLSRQGALVTTANDGSEALEKFSPDAYDVIFLDIQMPVMDGYQAVQKMRALGYTKPILALTAHAMSEEFQKSKAAGFDDHMTKPIEISHLITKVRYYADRSAAAANDHHSSPAI